MVSMARGVLTNIKAFDLLIFHKDQIFQQSRRRTQDKNHERRKWADPSTKTDEDEVKSMKKRRYLSDGNLSIIPQAHYTTQAHSHKIVKANYSLC